MEGSDENKNFGDALLDAKNALAKVGYDGLGLHLSKDVKGSIHGLGPVPVASALNQLKSAVSTLEKVAENKEVWTDRFYYDLGKLKGELSQQSKRVEDMKKALTNAAETCAREDPFAPPGFRLSRRVRLAAEKAGLQWAEEPSPDSVSVPELSIYGKTFLVGIHFQPDSNATDVNFVNVVGDKEDPADMAVNQDIERLLEEERIDEFERVLRTLLELETLDTKLGEFKLKDSLTGFEEDLLAFQKSEENVGASVVQRICLGHGLIRRTAAGLQIKYYATAAGMVKLKKQASSEGPEVPLEPEETYSADVGVDDATPPKAIAVGSQGVGTAPSIVPNLPLEFTFASESTQTVAAIYVLHLNPPVVCSSSLATSLASLSTPYSNEAGVPWTEKGTGLQMLLSPEAFDQGGVDVLRNCSLKDGSVVAFSHPGNRYLGATVSRIPVVHPRDLNVAFRLLRQQATFNELFTSCCHQDIDSADLSKEGRTVLSAEVVLSDPPSFLQVDISNSNEETAVLTIGISIAEGGQIHATLQGKNPWCSDATATKLLRASRNVPLSIYYMRKAEQGSDAMAT